MDRIIEKVVFPTPPKTNAKRVAAYTRVSSGKDAMLHSLSQQVSYFSTMIQNRGDWIYCGVYADEAISGTKDKRENFNRLLDECKKGKIDLIVTKSISRFARNTVTLLKTVRELKAIGVGVYFEEQNINTLSSDGELLLTILASYAQEEARSVSENQKWRVRKNFEEGKPWCGKMLGYRYENGVYIVIPEEAEIVKRIFAEYLSGKGVVTIMNELNREGIIAPRNGRWFKTTIMNLIRQYAYTGNLLLQRTYSNNYIDKKTCLNQGELPMYHVENSHEAIITTDDFIAVQLEIARRADFAPNAKKKPAESPFAKRIICGNCGKKYRRMKNYKNYKWVCRTYSYEGKFSCQSKQIPEKILFESTKQVLGIDEITSDVLDSCLTAIRAENDNRLVFCFINGEETVIEWKHSSRSESWTLDMREEARKRALEGKNE